MPSRVNHNQKFCRNKKNGFRIKSFVANLNKMATIWATMVSANLTKFCKIIRIVMDLVQIYHLSWPWSSRYYNQLKGILCVSVIHLNITGLLLYSDGCLICDIQLDYVIRNCVYSYHGKQFDSDISPTFLLSWWKEKMKENL